MSIRLLIAGAALSVAVAACAGDTTDDTAQEVLTPADSAAPAVSAAPAAQATIDVLSGASDLGPILVGPNGLSLYGFTNDVGASSTCSGTCAEAWPPVIVGADWGAGPGLDFGIFATTARDDGQLQLVAGQWPLYYFAGDAVPGDVNGQGSGDVWFVVDTDGRLTTAAAQEGADDAGDAGGDEAAMVSTATSELGDVLVDATGLTLYGFLNDTDGNPVCNDACADAWPPMIVPSADLPAGLDTNVFSVVERADGTFQLRAGVWPLYRFAGDGAAGDVNGQGSGDAWFAAAPDGSLIGAGDTGY